MKNGLKLFTASFENEKKNDQNSKAEEISVMKRFKNYSGKKWTKTGILQFVLPTV